MDAYEQPQEMSVASREVLLGRAPRDAFPAGVATPMTGASVGPSPPQASMPVIHAEIARLNGVASAQLSVEISAELVDVIAHRVLELQHEFDPGAPRSVREFLTVGELAARLRVNPKWVYAHQKRLGAIRLGTGPKARLRFPVTAVATELLREHPGEVAAGSSTHDEPQAKTRRRRRLASRPVPRIEPRTPRA
jgi:hypothetical protein